MQRVFPRFANWASSTAGRPITFVGAAAVVVVWALMGPVFGFTDTWQLVINTGTTIVTFLMVFLIQNTQNRDGEAMQVKLDEIIRSIEGAQNALLDLEGLDSGALDEFRDQYQQLAREAREQRSKENSGEPVTAGSGQARATRDVNGHRSKTNSPVKQPGEAVDGNPSPPKGPSAEEDSRDD
jgi:low affinity Fe/Cu permease